MSRMPVILKPEIVRLVQTVAQVLGKDKLYVVNLAFAILKDVFYLLLSGEKLYRKTRDGTVVEYSPFVKPNPPIVYEHTGEDGANAIDISNLRE